MDLLLAAVVVQVISGLAALAYARAPRQATLCGAGGASVACLLGLIPAVSVLFGAGPDAARLTWDAAHGTFVVELDVLSAFFLTPVLGLSGLAAIYGGDYLLARRHEKSLGPPWFFFNLFVAGMTLVLIARTTFLFLMAWEVMSLAAFFLVTFELENVESRRAGWIYLIATHLGAASLFFALMVLGWHAGSLEFAAFRDLPGLGVGWASGVFALALIGFGAKAGFVPLHVWLPEAHAAAPSHVSALMSGVMIKMGVYGMLRILTFLGPPQVWWGPTLALLGLLTALVGIALALQQRDIKRVLAYSSIENMGLIGLGLGIGLSGLAQGEQAVAVLGMTAALLHAWNHTLMKGLLFLAAGSVVHAVGARDMERMGGLMQRMPWTGSAMLIGAVALAALPPLNGFASKWLLYVSLLRDGLTLTGGYELTALLAVGLLALVGGLAAITFVRLIGIVLLGAPRSEEARHAHESSAWLRGPMFVLAALCVAIAIAPLLVAGRLFGVVDAVFGWQAGQALMAWELTETPLEIVGQLNAWVLAFVGAGAVGLVLWFRRHRPAEGATWGCGYVQPMATMQYTGRSFAEMMAEHLLPRFLRPYKWRRAPEGLFPQPGRFAADSPDPITKSVYEPFFRRWARRFARLRVLQQGQVHVYLVYIFIGVVLAMAWLSVRTWWRMS